MVIDIEQQIQNFRGKFYTFEGCHWLKWPEWLTDAQQLTGGTFDQYSFDSFELGKLLLSLRRQGIGTTPSTEKVTPRKICD